MTSFSTGYISYLLQISDLKNHKHKNSISYLEQILFPYLESHKENVKIFFYEKYRESFRKIFMNCFNNLTKEYGEVSVWPYGVTVRIEGLTMDYVKFALAQKSFDKLEFWCTHDIHDVSKDFFFISQNINATITLTGKPPVQAKD